MGSPRVRRHVRSLRGTPSHDGHKESLMRNPTLALISMVLSIACGSALPDPAPRGSALAIDTFEPPPPRFGAAFEDRELAPEEIEQGGHHHGHHGDRAPDAGAPRSGGGHHHGH
jgi:hypothetical protein